MATSTSVHAPTPRAIDCLAGAWNWTQPAAERTSMWDPLASAIHWHLGHAQDETWKQSRRERVSETGGGLHEILVAYPRNDLWVLRCCCGVRRQHAVLAVPYARGGYRRCERPVAFLHWYRSRHPGSHWRVSGAWLWRGGGCADGTLIGGVRLHHWVVDHHPCLAPLTRSRPSFRWTTPGAASNIVGPYYARLCHQQPSHSTWNAEKHAVPRAASPIRALRVGALTLCLGLPVSGCAQPASMPSLWGTGGMSTTTAPGPAWRDRAC